MTVDLNSLQASVTQMTQSVTDMLQTVSVQKAVLDAAVAGAQAAQNGAQVAQTNSEAYSSQSAGSAADAATSAQNAAASVGITQDTTFGVNEGEIASLVGQMWRELSNLPTDAPVTENALFAALSLIGQIAKQVNGGRVTLAGGTLADPAIKIGTVGIYSAAADTLSVAVAGVEIFRITAAGISYHGTSTTF